MRSEIPNNNPGGLSYNAVCFFQLHPIRLIHSIVFLISLILCSSSFAHEDDIPVTNAIPHETTDSSAPIACIYEWCDAKWPPVAGSDRTVGKTNCGVVCIKIVKEVEKIVTVHQKSADEVTITMSTNDKGEPIMKASCPSSGMTKYDYKLYKSGYVQKSKKKGDFLHIYYEKNID